MKRLLLLIGILLLPLLGGCAHNYYNLPQTMVADKVKVLGLVPIIVDRESDIRFPQREELITLLENSNRSYERELLRLLKESNNFYTVTMLDADPRATFSSMLFRRERRDDASIQYNKYFWKEEALSDFIRKNSLDAVMFVVVGGITRSDKLFSANLLDALTTDYNFLIMTAQIVDAKGTIIWEYPNFRQRALSYNPLINLQYPDFDEAKANMAPGVQVKFKTLEGVRRVLEKKRQDLLGRETKDAELYMAQFEEMVSLMSLDKEHKPAPATQSQDRKDAKESKK